MSFSNERNPQVDEVYVGSQAATITLPAKYFRKHSRLKNVRYVDQAGLTADNTNFLQLSLQDVSGNVIATYDSRAANQGALTAMVSKALVFSNANGYPTIDANNLEVDLPALTELQLVVTKNGTGVPTLGRLYLEWYPL